VPAPVVDEDLALCRVQAVRRRPVTPSNGSAGRLASSQSVARIAGGLRKRIARHHAGDLLADRTSTPTGLPA
jgi:hypothetical protein